MTTIARRHWLNTLVGVLDGAFYLSDEELYAVSGIITQLLERLHIPERGHPDLLPPDLAQELSAGYYSRSLSGPREAGVVRVARPATVADVVVTLETWREALVGTLTTAHPDLSADERILATKVFHDLLAAIGVPARAAAFYPEFVIDKLREYEG